jgi:small basic protein
MRTRNSDLHSTRKTAVPGFVAAILIVGFLRVTLTLSGVPDRFTTFFSISVVIAVSMIYFGVTCRQWRDRVLAAYVLFVPYTLIAVPALGYTWVTVNALALTTCAKVMVVLGKCREASCSHEAGARSGLCLGPGQVQLMRLPPPVRQDKQRIASYS